MAVSSLLQPISSSTAKNKTPKRKKKAQKGPSSWEKLKNLVSCKQTHGSQVHDPSRVGYFKLGSSCKSMCNLSDVVHGNTRVVHSFSETNRMGEETCKLLRPKRVIGSTGQPTTSGVCRGGYSNPSSRGMQFGKLSGCYECRTIVVDPSSCSKSHPAPRSSSICRCPHCGEVFPKSESLELHQAIRHAVSELGVEDSGRNIVEIIFKSSWLKKDNPLFSIQRILKVHNMQRTIQRFENCRDAVKSRATGRCAADGNELLRFHCTTISCALGASGGSALCGSRSTPRCGVCDLIRHGFSDMVRTTATSGRAHDELRCTDGRTTRAMMVCRVIAGKVSLGAAADAAPDNGILSATATATAGGPYDSFVVGSAGVYSDLEELVIVNPRAILPCFVVIYQTLL